MPFDDEDQNAMNAMNDDGAQKKWGRVFMGMRESSLSDAEQRRNNAWSEKDEEAYLARVRGKAEAKAREILEKAQQEADAMRQAAQEEGYNNGLAQAQAELEEFRAAMSNSGSAVLGAIESEAGAIFQTWREDLVALLQLSVEKALGLQLQADRRAVLESLYTQAVQTLESHRSLTVRCNPEDAPVVEDIITLTQERHPELAGWKVKADSTISPGGLIVESESSLADNRVESRVKAVMQALNHLFIPAN